MGKRKEIKFMCRDGRTFEGRQDGVLFWIRQIMATKGFSDKDPYAAAFFRNFSLDNDQLSELMDLVEAYPMREEEGAKIWLSEHPEVNEFFPTFAEK